MILKTKKVRGEVPTGTLSKGMVFLRERVLCVFFAKRIIGVTSANHMQLLESGRNFLLTTGYASIVEEHDIVRVNAIVEGALNAKPNTIQAFVTGMRRINTNMETIQN